MAKLRRISILIALGLLAGCGTIGSESPAVDTRSWDGVVRVDGILRAIMHEGETGTHVTLDTLLPNADLYALGALTDLAGEITVIGGQADLAYPQGVDSARTERTRESSAGATLLVAAEVPVWRALTTDEPIRFETLDEAIERLATTAGMDLDARFPFLIEGDFEELEWHVIDGTRLAPGAASHQDHLAAAVKASRAEASGTLIGFYSRHDQGVFTHMGSKTHVHCVLDGPPASGHVGHVLVPAGATVRFPAMPAGPRERKAR